MKLVTVTGVGTGSISTTDGVKQQMGNFHPHVGDKVYADGKVVYGHEVPGGTSIPIAPGIPILSALWEDKIYNYGKVGNAGKCTQKADWICAAYPTKHFLVNNKLTAFLIVNAFANGLEHEIYNLLTMELLTKVDGVFLDAEIDKEKNALAYCVSKSNALANYDNNLVYNKWLYTTYAPWYDPGFGEQHEDVEACHCTFVKDGELVADIGDVVNDIVAGVINDNIPATFPFYHGTEVITLDRVIQTHTCWIDKVAINAAEGTYKARGHGSCMYVIDTKMPYVNTAQFYIHFATFTYSWWIDNGRVTFLTENKYPLNDGYYFIASDDGVTTGLKTWTYVFYDAEGKVLFTIEQKAWHAVLAPSYVFCIKKTNSGYLVNLGYKIVFVTFDGQPTVILDTGDDLGNTLNARMEETNACNRIRNGLMQFFKVEE